MKVFKRLGVFALFLSIFYNGVYGYFYEDLFGASTPVWQLKYEYSRSLGYGLVGDGETVAINAGASGELRFTGNGYGPGYANELYGFQAKLTNLGPNTGYTASKEKPFGFEITRTYAWLDPHNDTSNPESGRMKCDLIFWLVKNQMTDGVHFDDFLTIIEFSRPQLGTNDGQPSEPDVLPRSFWTPNESGTKDIKFDFINAADPTGKLGGNNLIDLMEWGYDDSWGKNEEDGSGTPNPNNLNNADIRFRLTTDGEYAYFYVNPAPNGAPTSAWNKFDGVAATYTNTYYLVATLPISFTNLIIPMFGVGNNRQDSEQESAYFDNFLIRSVCSSITSYVSPATAAAGSSIALKLIVTPDFTPVTGYASTDYAGVQELYLQLPAGSAYTNWADYTNNLYVFWTTNGGVYQTFTNQVGNVNPSVLNGASISIVSNNLLRIRFDAVGSTSADCRVFHPTIFTGLGISALNPAIMLVISNFQTAAAADSVGKTFTVYANNEKYTDTTWAKNATTGKMKSFQQNGDGLKFMTVNPPLGIAYLRPGQIYEGTAGTFYYDVKALNTNNNANINSVLIKVPAGFTVTPGSLDSERLAGSTGLSLISNGTIIKVDYTSEGIKLVAGTGIDTIKFNTTTTTNVPANTNMVLGTFPSYSYSTVVGVSFVTNGTNMAYPSQQLVVRKKPPDAQAYAQNGTPISGLPKNYIKNTAISNLYKYVVANNGLTGNNLLKVLIRVDTKITSINSIASTLPATISSYSSNVGSITNFYIKINYQAQATNILSSGGDVITFYGYDNVASLTNQILMANFPSWADNGNGEGWVSVSEHADTYKTYYYTPPAIAIAKINAPGGESTNDLVSHHIFTDILTATNIQITIQNSGEFGNNVYDALIFCPPQLTNIFSIAAFHPVTKISNAICASYLTNGGTNVIHVQFTNLLKAATNLVGESCIVSFKAWDSVNASNDYSFLVQVKNTTNYTKAKPYAEDSQQLTLNFIYPKPAADAYITVPLGYIDSASSGTNVVYTIRNLGRVSNIIQTVYIHIPTNYIQDVPALSISSSLGGVPSFTGDKISITYSGNTFAGGLSDNVSFFLNDSVSAGSVHFDIQASVQNQRMWSNFVKVTPTKSQTVDIIPPPTWYAYTIAPYAIYRADLGQTKTNIVCISVSNRGVGSNLLDRVWIQIPAQFIGKVLLISNELLNGTSVDKPGAINISNDYIRIDYDLDGGQYLDAGAIDNTYIWLLVNTTNVFTSTWNMLAANNSTNADGSHNMTNGGWTLAVDGLAGSKTLSQVDTPYAYLTPNEILTPSVKNTFAYFLKNGDYTNGRNISSVKIVMLTPFTKISNCSGGDTYNSYYSNNSAIVEVGYASGIAPNNAVSINFTVYDNWESGPNNVSSEIYVNYNDGTGWYNTKTKTGSYFKDITFNNPIASGLSFSEPDSVSQDFPTNTYKIHIKNSGETDNNILMMAVEIPAAITNITSISSTVKGGNCYYNNGLLLVYYTNAAQRLNTSETDVVQFIGADNITNTEVAQTWKVYVDNTTNTNISLMQAAVEMGGKSLALNIVKPDYSPYIYISASNYNYVSQFDPNTVYSTFTTNYLYFEIWNQSGTGNRITYAKIKIPGIDTVFDTNWVSVSSVNKTIPAAVISNGYIWLDYSSDKIFPGESDKVLIKIRDIISHSETSVTWSADVAFDSTYNQYKPATLMAGKSLAINFVMPLPSASVTKTPGEIYLNRPDLVISYNVSNTGDGSNDLNEVKILLPSIFRAGFSASKVSNSAATNITYASASGLITLKYANLTPKSVDKIFLYVTNAASASQNVTIESSVKNYINTNYTSGNKDLSLTSVPSFSVSPNDIDTSTNEQEYVFTINNSVNANTLHIQKLVVQIPSQFTNYLIVANDIPVSNYGMITSLTLDYLAMGTNIQVGDQDTIRILLQDDYEIGNLTNAFYVWAHNGQGYYPMNISSGKSANAFFMMPEVYAKTLSTPDYIELGKVSNSMTITLTNIGSGSDRISFAKIKLPFGMASIANINSAYGGVVTYSAASNIIYLRYTNLLDIGKSDDISFDFVNTINQITNLSIEVLAANLTNNPVFYNCSGNLGQYLMLSVDYPPVAAESYFYGENNLYLIETNATLTFRIMNRSTGSMLTQSIIVFGTNMMDVFNHITIDTANSIAQTIVFDTNNNRIILNYSAIAPSSMEFTEYDDIRLTFDYALNDMFYIQVHTTNSVVLETLATTNIIGIQTGGNLSYIGITNSAWGAVKGTVYPYIKAVNVKLYYSNTTVLATNDSGINLGALSTVDTGQYILSRIPAGDYSMEFSLPGVFKKESFFINIAANKITNISIMTMRNDTLKSGDVPDQEVICYMQTNTRIVFPKGSVGNEFSVDIKVLPLTAPQKAKIDDSKLIKHPLGKDGMFGYLFQFYDNEDDPIGGSLLELDAIMYLAFDPDTNIGWGWQVVDLAIFYWDDNGDTDYSDSKWVRIGGTVDSVNNVVTARVAYLHGFYAVMAKLVNEQGIIQNVVLRPKIFTPYGSGDYYTTIRISFEFDKEYDSYEVKIYDLFGMLVRSFKRTAEGGVKFTQGEVAWDGKDDEGYPIKGGVYIYQVIVGGQTYSGTLVIVR
ncbi:MAG: hypothetical protein A2014_10820 [Spirochaetes bacterium GWF1_49_6]|nr:MAG: hypothetical protein A2014_10820 [Spirochaetes bacterium GWF1_49_6]